MKKVYINLVLLLIVLISAGMHYKHFSKDLMSIHVWRQTETQSNINNFYEEDMNILNPRINARGNGNGIFRMEFPLMQWLVACTYKIFGNHLIISRFMMFIIGLFSILGIYKLIKIIFQNEIMAVIGAWAFNFSPSFYYYTINPMPDNLALCLSIWGIFIFFNWHRKRKDLSLLMSGFLLALGALCKLPFILYYSVPLIYFLYEIIKTGIKKNTFINIISSSLFILLPLLWYVKVVPQWQGNGIVKGMINNDLPASNILDYLQSNLISTLPELLLNYGSLIFFLISFYYLIKNKAYKNSLFPLFVGWSTAILLYFLFEINMIRKIHDYYLFPFLPILFILVSYGAYNLYSQKIKLAKYAVIFMLLILPFTAYLRMQVRWNPDSPGLNKDLLTYKDELRNAVPKNALCIAGSDDSNFIFLYYINKKGWGFDSDNFSSDKLWKIINEGAEYLYSDSRKVDENKDISKYLDKLVLQRGSVKIFSLKKINPQQ